MAFGTPPFSAHVGGQDEKSAMGVVGQLGTADTGGTAQILPMAVNPSTGAAYSDEIGTTIKNVFITGGTVVTSGGVGGGTNVNVVTGTVNQIGTILGIGGTVTVTGASAGTFVNVSTGSQQTLGTVGVVNNLVTGTLASSGTTTGVGVVTSLTNGSINVLSGTVTSIGTVLGIGGTVQVSGASAGTNVNVVTGTANVADSNFTGNITANGQSVTGTLNGVSSLGINIGGTFVGTIQFQGAIDGVTYNGLACNILGGGGYSTSFGSQATGNGQWMAATGGYQTFRLTSTAWTSGTAIITLHGGLGASYSYLLTPQTPTVNVGNFGIGQFGNGDGLNSGITSALAWTGGFLYNATTGTSWDRWREGNITGAGLVQITPKSAGSVMLSTEVRGTAGAGLFGTIIAPVGAGTSVYIAGLAIVVTSGTVDCGITNNVVGSSGAGVYARGQFVPGGGIARDYYIPLQTGTNGTIAYFLNGAGTVDFTLNYWVGP